MENYSKGKNVEEALERDKIPIPNLPPDFLWMQVRGGSKIRNLLSHALNEFQEIKSVVWTGFGPSVGKATSCAELMKRECGGNLHQVTKICYRLIEEHWTPKIPELDEIVVKRKIPVIHILLSSLPVDVEILGYQGPGTTIDFKMGRSEDKKQYRSKSSKYNRTPTKEFAAMDVDSKKQSKKHQFNKRKPIDQD